MDNGPPRGTRDLLPDSVARREAVIAELARSYGRFGFRRIETPCIEDIDRLTWGEGGDNEKLIYRILRRGLDPIVAAETPLADVVDLGLRYDLTVPLTRFYANNAGKLVSPYRSMQIGPVWRAERPQRGRYRQFTQCDIDTIGEPSVLAEAELLEGTLAALAAIGIERVTVRVNDRRLLASMALEAGVDAEALAPFFVTLDKLDRIGWQGVRAELAERGYTHAVGARCEQVVALLASAETASEALDRASDLLPALPESVLADLRATFDALGRIEATAPPEAVASRLDASVVRGMGYYTGQIFEFAHPDAPSSIAGGGRYDGLIGRSLGTPVAACGISIGFDRVVEMARFSPPDLGVAVLYAEGEPPDEVLETARRLRSAAGAAALVALRGQRRLQLESLQKEGYTSFVVVEAGSVSQERPIRP
ncbi:MAG TPA: ATP phosphoribosyltransferase regulatory subunit [Acidimicrobiales bacterium]|nr:ATP phosphoribosyltransferase regulatory subunit [Acidimicrobiales bacterium]